MFFKVSTIEIITTQFVIVCTLEDLPIGNNIDYKLFLKIFKKFKIYFIMF